MPSCPRALPASTVSAALALTLLLGGCAASSKFTEQWRDPTWAAPPMTNVYVVALRPDPERRRQWEDALVAGLSRYHVRAIPSYKKYRDAPPDTQQVIDEVRANGFDGVMVSMRLPDAGQRTTTTRTEVVSEKRSFTSNYSTVQKDVQESKTIETTLRSVRTDVWSTIAPGRLVWTGTVQSDAKVSYELIMKIASTELPDRLAKEGLLPPLPKNP